MNDCYHAYLLRLERSEPSATWRALLENVHTGEQNHFETESALLVYLGRLLLPHWRAINPETTQTSLRDRSDRNESAIEKDCP